jgi:isocitrate dehydrogenase
VQHDAERVGNVSQKSKTGDTVSVRFGINQQIDLDGIGKELVKASLKVMKNKSKK